MSFLDFCNTLFEKASEKLQQMQEEYENYRERYEEKDDETLIRYLNKRSCSFAERQAIASILHDRGNGTDDINIEEDTKY